MAGESPAHWGDGPDLGSDPVPITDLFSIWVDHFGLSVLDAVEALAVQLSLSGYPEDADEVAFADAMDMSTRVRRSSR